MSAGFTQANLSLTVSTPLGTDKLLLVGFHGEEPLSGLFHFTLEMVSEDHNLDFSAIVGQSATVALTLADSSKRYVNGIVGRFVQADTDARFTAYYADLYPWLWLLTMTSDCRIFQNKTVPEIIESVFSELGFTDYKNSLSGTYTAREYGVQYEESAFDFVSRLMEDEGIFYFFEHTEDTHTLVLADDASVFAACPGLPEGGARLASETLTEEDVIVHCTLEQQVTPTKYTMDDFNFETPATDLVVSANGTGAARQIYEFPGGFTTTDAGESRANRRIQAYELLARLLRGESYCRAFIPGYTFALSGHPRDDLNATYVLRQVSHTVTQQGYSNSFEAFPAEVPFRPARVTKKPLISGSQTAIVVGKSGEEIWTDKYGRVKVQFHWDRLGKNDENSSCWVRVAQGWGGRNWGSLFIPRIGQEAIVSFLEGDPDRPIITGTVYNAQQTVPYTLPDDQTKSTIKTNSSKGGGGFNEIRFEDKKDSEEIFMQAQKDMNIQVLNNQTSTIKQNRQATIQEGNETLVVDKGNRTIQVNTGNETHEVKGTRALTITGDESHTNKADFTQEVSGNFTLKVSGNITIEAQGSVSIKAGTSVTNEAGTSLTNKAGTDLTNQSGTSLTNKSGTDLTNQAGTSLTNKASLSLTNDGGISLTNKASASQEVDGGGMLTLKGGLVKVN